jgi:hypothetical protein
LSHFSAVSTGDPLVVELHGGRMTVTPGTYTVDVTVTGQTSGQVATTSVALSLVKLGDVNRDGKLMIADKALLVGRMNRLSPYPQPERAYDLNGDGQVGLADQSLMTTLLNRLPVQ